MHSRWRASVSFINAIEKVCYLYEIMDIKLFNDIENKYGLMDWDIDGIKIWRYERFLIYNYLNGTGVNKLGNLPAHGKSKKKEILKLLTLYFNHSLYNQKHVDLMILNHPRRVLQDGKYICKYTEAISEMFNSATYEAYYNISCPHFKPTNSKSLYYLDRIIINSHVYEMIIRGIYKKKFEEVKRDIKERIEQGFTGLSDEKTYDDLADIMARHFFALQFKLKRLRKLIKKVNPRAIVEVVGYNQNNMAVNEIAHELGIPTIELQHSQVNPSLIQYMWGDSHCIDQFPDYFFTFGDFWKKGLELPIPDNHIRAVGFPFFEDEIKKYTNSVVKKNKKILFISQFLAGQWVYELAIEYSKLFPEDKIIYKLHPDEYSIWKEKYPELVEYDNISVSCDKSISLYECFAESYAVVGVFSGALFEALAFGLPVYLYNAKYIENMQILIDNQGAIVFNSANELKELITNEERAKISTTDMWKTNSIENIKNNIMNIMEDCNNGQK